MMKHFDLTSLVTIALTVILFVAALFIKGFTHDLLLEGGVFLVSVKLMHGSYKNSVNIDILNSKLDQILDKLNQ